MSLGSLFKVSSLDWARTGFCPTELLWKEQLHQKAFTLYVELYKVKFLKLHFFSFSKIYVNLKILVAGGNGILNCMFYFRIFSPPHFL